jgi:uncharacterized membrane protein YkoI
MNPVHMVLLGWLMLLLLGSLGAIAVANDRSPRQLKPLDQIVESLENTGYVVVEVEVDDGHWEVDAHKGDDSYELHIDPATGKIIAALRDEAGPVPSDKAMKLSELLRSVHMAGYAPIASVEFKRGKWEIEVRKGRLKHEIEVDAHNGRVLTDRLDE